MTVLLLFKSGKHICADEQDKAMFKWTFFYIQIYFQRRYIKKSDSFFFPLKLFQIIKFQHNNLLESPHTWLKLGKEGQICKTPIANILRGSFARNLLKECELSFLPHNLTWLLGIHLENTTWKDWNFGLRMILRVNLEHQNIHPRYNSPNSLKQRMNPEKAGDTWFDEKDQLWPGRLKKLYIVDGSWQYNIHPNFQKRDKMVIRGKSRGGTD